MSTIHAVEKIINTAKKKSADKWRVLIIVDAQNAFDSTSWAIIMDKLDKKGIPDYTLSVLTSCLSNRFFIVYWEDQDRGGCWSIARLNIGTDTVEHTLRR